MGARQVPTPEHTVSQEHGHNGCEGIQLQSARRLTGHRVPASEAGQDAALWSWEGLCPTGSVHIYSTGAFPYRPRATGRLRHVPAPGVTSGALRQRPPSWPWGHQCRWNRDRQVFVLFQDSASRPCFWQKYRVSATVGSHPGNEAEYEVKQVPGLASQEAQGQCGAQWSL